MSTGTIDGVVAASGGLRAHKRQTTRRHLQEVATDLFASRGYEHVTVADIAAACEISEKTFFSYFPSKLDAALADVDEELDRLEVLVAARPGGQSVTDMLVDAAHGRIDLARTFTRNVALRAGEPVLAERAATRRARRERQLLAEPLAEDIGCDVDDPRVALAVAAFSGISNALDDLLADEGDPSVVIGLAVATLRSVVAGLKSAGGGPAAP